MATILIIDDDPGVSAVLGAFFERRSHHVVRAGSCEDGVDTFMRVRPDLVLLDLRLPDGTGFDVLTRLAGEEAVVIMITGHADVPLAVQAMQAGAEHFLQKPVDPAHLEAAVDRALEKARLRQLAQLARERRGGGRVSALLGTSPAMRELAHQVELLAATDRTTVLLVGETGTGKGRLAEMIHATSPRAEAPFLDVSCVGMPSDALEEELFGSEVDDRPRRRRAALVEIAEQGTLFLDEVVGLDPVLQPRLLKLLEARTYRRAGGVRETSADVRVIASTCRDLVEEVNAGRLREELYYRLSVMPVHLPPLRARAREDVVDLIERLMHELQIQVRSAPSEIADGAWEVLLRYPWPGNLRELRNVLERALIVARGARRVGAEHLPSEVRRASGAGLSRHVPRSLDEVERAHIERTLRAHNGNRTRASRELGISRATLINKIKQFNLGEMVMATAPRVAGGAG